MYLSRIQLRLDRLTPPMMAKWQQAMPYASHQWLWQLFPDQDRRAFLFRQEPASRFYVLSSVAPLDSHVLFDSETKPFTPRLQTGLLLDFQLRANAVVTRNGKRSDVMMDAKYRAKASALPPERWWPEQVDAARAWLVRQGEQHGFTLAPRCDAFDAWAGEAATEAAPAQALSVDGYRQHHFSRREGEAPIAFSSVDYAGTLRITNVERFAHTLHAGLGKSKALGCGLLMVKKAG